LGFVGGTFFPAGFPWGAFLDRLTAGFFWLLTALEDWRLTQRPLESRVKFFQWPFRELLEDVDFVVFLEAPMILSLSSYSALLIVLIDIFLFPLKNTSAQTLDSDKK